MRQKTNARVIEQRERERQCLELRRAGATYAEISDELKISKNGAWKAVSRAIAEITKEPATRVRNLELSRLDALQVRLWEKASRGDLAAIDRIMKIMERRARLLGLDAQKGADEGGGSDDTKPTTVVIRITGPKGADDDADD